MAKGKYFAVVMGDVYKKSEVIPLGFYVMYMLKKNFKVKLKGILVKNIEGNRGNTMITLYEADRLINLIVAKNKGKKLNSVIGGYSYDETSNKIVPHTPAVYDISTGCVQLL